MKSLFYLILVVIPLLITSSAISATTNCKTNNVYQPYSTPFACQQDSNEVTPSAVSTINFEYQQPHTQCTIVTSKPETVYLNHYVNCQQNTTKTTTRKIQLAAGANVIDFSSSCYQDSNANHANLFFENQDSGTRPSVMVSCTSVGKAAGKGKEATLRDNFASLGVL